MGSVQRSSDVDLASPRGGGRDATPAAVGPPAPTRARLGRVARSAWAPVLLKGIGASLLLLALALVGYVSSLPGSGATLERRLAPSHALVGEAWAAGGGPDAGASAASGDAGARRSGALTADGKVVLNLAGPDELTRLPGIGKRRAEAIVALRARLKRFRKVSQLLGVRGIGRRRLDKIAPLVVLDPPEPASPADAGGAGR